jgi:hypothetical protein
MLFFQIVFQRLFYSFYLSLRAPLRKSSSIMDL